MPRYCCVYKYAGTCSERIELDANNLDDFEAQNRRARPWLNRVDEINIWRLAEDTPPEHGQTSQPDIDLQSSRDVEGKPKR